MSTSLYQKYRPQTFAELVGQDHIVQTLLNELKSGTVSHAYMLSGPRGIGKTTTARLLARAVNCEQPNEGEPCNSCASCESVQAGKALDIVEIDAASHTGVDNVRENIIENSRVAPSSLKWKVFIIDEVHMLSTSAFNALLKTLEEPPSFTMFILATTEIHKVPSTIVSRCERFNFRKITFEGLVGRLKALAKKEGIQVDAGVIEAIAKRSEGALRDAESLLGQVLSLDDKHVTLAISEIVLPRSEMAEVVAFWEEIVRGQAAPAIARVNRLLDEGVMLNEFTKDLVEFLRKVLLYRVQQALEPLQYLDLQSDELERVTGVAEKLSNEEIARMIEVFLEALEQQKTAMIAQLPLELAVVELTNNRDGGPSGSVRGGGGSPIAGGEGPAQDVDPKPSTQPPHQQATLQPPPAGKNEASGAMKPDETGRDAPPSVTIDQVKKQWNSLLKGMKNENHALYLTFKVGRLVSCDNGTLTIGYEYQFYQDRLNDARNRSAIDTVLEQVFGEKLVLDVLVGPEYAMSDDSENANIQQPADDEVANVWDLAASAFPSEQQGG